MSRLLEAITTDVGRHEDFRLKLRESLINPYIDFPERLQLMDRLLAIVNADIPAIRCGRVNVSAIDTSVVITFSSPMPDANYEVLLQNNSPVSTHLWPTARTVNGFTLNLSVGINASISYFVISGPTTIPIGERRR